MPETTPPSTNKIKEKIFTVRLNEAEWNKLQHLKGSPYYINIAHWFRDALDHLYEKRTTKAGRPKP